MTWIPVCTGMSGIDKYTLIEHIANMFYVYILANGRNGAICTTI